MADQNDILIKYAGLESDSWGDYKIKLTIENNSDTDATVQIRDMSLNGYMIDGIMSCDVVAGKKANDGISIWESKLEENNITELEETEFYFHVYTLEGWDTIFDSDVIKIEFK